MRRSAPDLPTRTGHPRRGTVASVLASAALLCAGAVALASGGDAPVHPSQLTEPTTPRTVVPSEEQSPATRSAAAVPFEPLLTPPAVRWQLFAGVPLPYSDSAGPSIVEGPVHAGFERSQGGALLAAAHLGTRYLLTPGSGWRDVVAHQVLPGSGRDAYVRLRATVDDATTRPGTHGQPAGFRILAFTPDVAVVQEAVRFPLSGVLQVTSTTLRWVGEDWRLQLQPDGSTSPTAQQVPDLDGFVVWGP